MPENVQYEAASPAERLPTHAPDMRSTLDVSPDRALPTIYAVMRKSLHQQQVAGQTFLPPSEAS